MPFLKNSIFSNKALLPNKITPLTRIKNKKSPNTLDLLPIQCLKNPFTKRKRQKNLLFPLNINLYYFKLFPKATYFMSYILPIVEFSNVIKFKTLTLVTFLPILKKCYPNFEFLYLHLLYHRMYNKPLL